MEWNDSAIEGIDRFLKKIWDLVETVKSQSVPSTVPVPGTELRSSADLRRAAHAAIKRVTEYMESFKFNTAISALMELRNAIEKSAADPAAGEALEALVHLIGPFAPHFAEELWEKLGHTEWLARSRWPSYDAALLVQSEVTLVVQVNGKVRSRITIPADLSNEEIKSRVLADPAVRKWLDGKSPKDLIIVPNRLVNVVLG